MSDIYQCMNMHTKSILVFGHVTYSSLQIGKNSLTVWSDNITHIIYKLFKMHIAQEPIKPHIIFLLLIESFCQTLSHECQEMLHFHWNCL